MLHWLGIKPSYSRPRVSNDNAFAESAFRTAKYRPEYVRRGFKDLDQARSWASEFVHWYNVEHLHSVRIPVMVTAESGIVTAFVNSKGCAVLSID